MRVNRVGGGILTRVPRGLIKRKAMGREACQNHSGINPCRTEKDPAMSVMSLLVFAEDSDASAPRLETAIAMAERHGAQLSVCALAEQPAYYYGVGTEVAADIYMQDVERARAVADEVAGIARTRLERSGHDGGVRSATGTAVVISEIAARNARYADLSLIGQPFDCAAETLLNNVFEGVLFNSGRPQVMVPRDWSGGAFGERVMIAWAPCKEAARAVSDAMPFIEAAESVNIAIIDPDTGDDAHGDEPGADLAATLARHGVKVSVDPLPSAGKSVAERLLIHAISCNADLIVMGGYGHWRLRETLFGGVTRDMIRESTVPMLLAH
jgi:nucleotide-binding universal stress UspA family protein